MHWTQNWVFIVSFAFYSVWLIRWSLNFGFDFPLLPSDVLHGWIALFFLLHTALSSLITLPWKSGNGNLLWVFLGRDFGENSWVVEQKTQKGMGDT